jgi:TfoX/Sxy family transcriptional regulator of competence genes
MIDAAHVASPGSGSRGEHPLTGGGSVPYDAELADRVRHALADRTHVREVRMFGGLALMVDDRMLVCVSGGGSDLLVRVAPDRDAELVTKPGAQRAQMGANRSMGPGWIAVDRRALASDDDLRYWVHVALDFHAQGAGTKARTSPGNS